MSRLHVLLLTTSYPISENSTSGIFVKYLVKSLSVFSDITVIAPADDTNESISADTTEKIVTCPYAPTYFQTLAQKPGGIPAKLRKNKFSILLVPLLLSSLLLKLMLNVKNKDILHCNWAISGFLASILRRFIRFPVVTTLRGEDVKQSSGMLSKHFLNSCIKHSDKIVLVSNEMNSEMAKLYPQYKHKLLTIHNGVDAIFSAKEIAASENNCNEPVLRMVSVASLIPRKNLSHILNSLAICHEQGLDFKYTIIGEGEELSKLKKLAAKLCINKKVVFAGNMRHGKIAVELSKAPLFLTASLHEGRPNTVIEAMAAGACILASDISGHRELVNDSKGGRIFQVNDLSSLSSIIMEMSKAPQSIREFGLNARCYIDNENLTWEGCAKKYQLLFESLRKVV